MPQIPFKTDAVQIEPGSGESLIINRDSTDGSMTFTDNVITSGISLQNLVGLRNVEGVYVVGKSNSPYMTIQEALDAVPNTSTSLLPSTLIILPGVYQENISIQKDGLTIIGMGATLVNDGDSHTVSITSSVDVSPKSVELKGLTVKCTADNKACVSVIGAYAFATGSITVSAAPLLAGDTLTFKGVPLLGVAGVRTSGLDNFSVSLGSPEQIAVEIANAINDENNSFHTLVSAVPAGAQVQLTSILPGSIGNTITLTSSTVDISLSGAALTGGSSSSSPVLSEGLVVEDCNLVAEGIGAYQILADTVNFIRVFGGSFLGSSSSSLCSIVNCSSFSLNGTAWVNDLGLTYDVSLDQPLVATSEYQIYNCPRVNDIFLNLVGMGVCDIKGSDIGVVTFVGDRDVFIDRSDVSDFNISDTVQCHLTKSDYGSVFVVGGTPIFEVDKSIGTVNFAAVLSETVSFGYTRADANYQVVCTSSDPSIVCGVSAKTTTGFTISTSASLTGSVDYILRR